MAIVDRRGITVGEAEPAASLYAHGGIAVKAAVVCATTANITLSGLQILDGVTVVADDRVLVKNQTDASENGVYNASSGTWQRAGDFDGAGEVAKGTQVFVAGGTTLGNSMWYVSSANPVTIGTSDINWTKVVLDGADGEDGADGLGWTGGSYNASNGIVTFTSDDGLGFVTGDLRGADGSDGADGADGSNGADGADGNSAGLYFTFSTTTTMADPGAGTLRFNNATPASVTAIAIDDTTADSGNPDVSADITSWADSTATIKGRLIVREVGSPQNFHIYTISGLTDNTGWTELAVSHVSGSGTFADTDNISVEFSRTGDDGADGAGTGDVVGPASATDSNFAAFDTATGKLLKDSGSAATDFQAVLAEGAFVDGDKTKLDGIETSATADQTAQEIATAIDADATAENTLREAIPATDSAKGTVELATSAEINTGTDTGRVITPDALAASDFGIVYVQITAFEYATNTATGDGAAYFHVPAAMDGMDLVEVHAEVITAGTTGTTDIQIANVTQAADMLSTKLTIDSSETGSDTAAAAAVIDTANDDIAENDLLRIDVDAVSTTPAQGLIITMGFRKP